MRPFKLGLSRPKSKKKTENESDDKSESTTDISQMDEINVSRETIEDISDTHLRRVVKAEPESILDRSIQSDAADEVQCKIENESIVDLVNKVSKSHEQQPVVAEVYDLEKQFEPQPGPSNIKVNHSFNQTFNESDNEIESSLESNRLGIISFYDKSKIFDITLEDTNEVVNESQESVKTERFEPMFVDKREIIEVNHTEVEMESDEILKEENVKTEQNVTLFERKGLKILTPKIKPPTKSYVCLSLPQYNIPKVKNPEPYYSDHNDVGDKVEIGQMVLKVNSKLSRDQKPFEKVLDMTSIEEWRHLLFLQTNEMSQESTKPDALKKLLAGNRNCILEPVKKPPTSKEVKMWLLSKDGEVKQEDKSGNDEDISKNIDELDNSQALGLKYEISSISLEVDEKVSLTHGGKSANFLPYNLNAFFFFYRRKRI